MQSKFGHGMTMVAVSLALLAGGGHAAAVEAAGGGQRGSVSHGPAQSYLGVDVRDVAEERVTMLKLKEARGAEIVRVDHDGPAGKMGLRERDVVVQMNGTVIEGEEQIRRMLRETPPGRAIVLVISRDGQQMTVTAQMADRNEVERQAWEQHLSAPAFHPPAPPQAPATGLPSDDPSDVASGGVSAGPVLQTRYSKSFLGTLLMTPSYTGVRLERVSPQLATFFGLATGSGLLVQSVEDNSPAAMAGLKAGDVVVRANARNVASMTDWAKTIREAKGRPVSVVVMRDRQEKTFTLTPDGKKRSSLELPVNGIVVARLTEL